MQSVQLERRWAAKEQTLHVFHILSKKLNETETEKKQSRGMSQYRILGFLKKDRYPYRLSKYSAI